MKPISRVLVALTFAATLVACGDGKPQAPAQPVAQKPALTVTTTVPQRIDWPQTLAAAGNVAAWQETVIGAELANQRIAEVLVNVGDRVKKGQVLARIAADTVEAEFAEMRAAVAEAEAAAAEARANHERARQLATKGFYSAEQAARTQAAADTAAARLAAARARLLSAELRRAKATVRSPDDGIIAARAATVGTLTQSGQELFRLIRGGRLEWRAEVTAGELNRLAAGMVATVAAPDGSVIEGRVRAVAPSVDPQTRLALVYVDLPQDAAAKLAAGMFARGEFRLGSQPALTLPQAAVLLREGFAYVFRVEGGEVAKVREQKVGLGRRVGERVEVLGVDEKAVVAAGGVGFLADGDTVRVVGAVAPAAPERKP